MNIDEEITHAIIAVRNEALEEAAKVAERYGREHWSQKDGITSPAESIAYRIRALKEKV